IFAEIHNIKKRQAVVIHKYDYEKWLDPKTSISELKKMMLPLTDDETHYRPVESEDDQGKLF
ncbi:MAG: hypothetical protein ABIV48_03920, partial [Pyrinomonadaceae bacterium]